MYLEVHEKFSKIGIEKLRNALKSTSSHPRAPQNDGVAEFDVEKMLPSFFLGNWLTDVSQVVDPVAYAKVCKFIEKLKMPWLISGVTSQQKAG